MNPRRRRNRLDFRSVCLRAKMSLQKLTGLRSIRVVHDILAVENASRLVTAEFHRYALRDAGAHHVSNRSAPEIVHNDAAKSGLLTCRVPGFPEVADRLPIIMKDVWALWPPLLMRSLNDLQKLPP